MVFSSIDLPAYLFTHQRTFGYFPVGAIISVWLCQANTLPAKLYSQPGNLVCKEITKQLSEGPLCLLTFPQQCLCGLFHDLTSLLSFWSLGCVLISVVWIHLSQQPVLVSLSPCWFSTSVVLPLFLSILSSCVSAPELWKLCVNYRCWAFDLCLESISPVCGLVLHPLGCVFYRTKISI